MDLLTSDGFGIFLTSVLAFIICASMIPVIIRIARAKRLFDSPDGIRKIHTSMIPNLGGIAIFAAVLFAFSVSGYAGQLASYPYLVAGMIILFITGMKDDLLVIAPSKKFFGQLLASLLIIWGGDFTIQNLGGVFGIYEISELAGILLTLFTFIVVINAYNLIDGIDGLAGGIGIISSASFGLWFFSTGHIDLALLTFIVASALIGFLMYNHSPASIFMGDTGSQIIGFLLAFIALNFLNIGTAEGVAVPFKNAVPILAVSILIVPLYDTLRVFIIRTLNKRPFFQPDRQHIHHQLLSLGYSHGRISLISYIQNITIIGLTLVLADFNVNILLGIVLLSSLCIFPTFYVKRSLLKLFGIRVSARRKIFSVENLIVPRSNGTNGVTNGSSNGHHKHKEEQEDQETGKLAV